MTVTLTKSTANATPAALARAAIAEARAARPTRHLNQIVSDLTTAIETLLELAARLETVTEYGVLAWSNTFGCHHVDECRDQHDAEAVLAATRSRIDPSAQLVQRNRVTAQTVGEWTPVTQDTQAAAHSPADTEGDA